MKARKLLAACFAGAGIYFLLTGSVTVVASALLLVQELKLDLHGTGAALVAQYLVGNTPFIVGVLCLILAAPLARLAGRFAKIEEDDIATGLPDPPSVITVACVVTGLVMAITQIPELVRLLYQHFLVAANPTFAAAHRGENFTMQMVRPTVFALVAIVVLLNARTLGRWLDARHAKN